MIDKGALYRFAQGFLAKGWVIFPVGGSDGKRPLVKWGDLVATSDEQVREWLQCLPMTGWGMPTGVRSGVVVVDIDGGDVPGWVEPTYTVTTPRGWHFYYAHEGRIKNSVKILGDNVDVRGDGGYVVTPGSYRPGGGLYVEEGGEVAKLPSYIVERSQPPPKAALVVVERGPTDADVYRRAEAYAMRCAPAISGSGGHAQALVVARAMTQGFGLGPNEALSAMAPWNCSCQPPWSAQELMHKVRSALTTPDPAGRSQGYLLADDSPLVLIDDLEALDELPEVLHAPQVAPTPDEDAIREDIARQIGEIGDIGRMYMGWLRESSRIWQPGLASGSALVLGAALAGRRWQWRGTTSHLYVLGVGGSGTGKDVPAKRLAACLGEHVMGGIPSTKAMRDRLAETSQKGHGLVLVSGEVAKLLRQILGARTPAYLQLAGQMLLELATWGPEPMRFDRAASDQAMGGDQQLVVHSPSFSIFGTATPEDLLDILGEGAVKDGMLGRFVIFRAQERLPDKDVFLQPKPMPSALAKVIADRAREISNWITCADNDIFAPPPDEMPGSQGHILAAYDAEIHRARQLAGRQSMPDELVARLAEHATRIAIALAGLSSNPRVTESCERLAIAIVEQSARDLADTTRRHSARDAWERGLKRVIAAMERLAGVDGYVRACDLAQSVRARELPEWIDALQKEGVLLCVASKNKVGRQSTRYRLAR